MKPRCAVATMRITAQLAAGLVPVALAWAAPGALAASFDCRGLGLSRTEIAICADQQLTRIDEQMGRRVDGFARRMNFGQYLGLRHWQSAAARQRDVCDVDRTCIAAHYRAQGRF